MLRFLKAVLPPAGSITPEQYAMREIDTRSYVSIHFLLHHCVFQYAAENYTPVSNDLPVSPLLDGAKRKPRFSRGVFENRNTIYQSPAPQLKLTAG